LPGGLGPAPPAGLGPCCIMPRPMAPASVASAAGLPAARPCSMPACIICCTCCCCACCCANSMFSAGKARGFGMPGLGCPMAPGAAAMPGGWGLAPGICCCMGLLAAGAAAAAAGTPWPATMIFPILYWAPCAACAAPGLDCRCCWWCCCACWWAPPAPLPAAGPGGAPRPGAGLPLPLAICGIGMRARVPEADGASWDSSLFASGAAEASAAWGGFTGGGSAATDV
jgi:hypothetical protein